MTGHEFIFSNQPTHRLVRHGTFWLGWWFFFFGSYFTFQQLRPQPIFFVTWDPVQIAKSVLIVLTHAGASYAILYSLLPRLLNNRQWFFFIGNFLLVSAGLFGMVYLEYSLVFTWLDDQFHSAPVATPETMVWASANTSILNGLKVIAVAMTIKLLKGWWLKEQEKQRIEREKIDTELQLIRTQLRPKFLIDSLNSIYHHALTSSSKAPQILLQLSDLLSYMLYESSQLLVSLEREIHMVRGYIALESERFHGKLDVDVQIKGTISAYSISPSILLPFVENSFRHCSRLTHDHPWINLELAVEKDYLNMKLVNAYSSLLNNDRIDTMTSKMQALYGDRFELKAGHVEEMYMVSLRLPVESTLSKSNEL